MKLVVLFCHGYGIPWIYVPSCSEVNNDGTWLCHQAAVVSIVLQHYLSPSPLGKVSVMASVIIPPSMVPELNDTKFISARTLIINQKLSMELAVTAPEQQKGHMHVELKLVAMKPTRPKTRRRWRRVHQNTILLPSGLSHSSSGKVVIDVAFVTICLL